VYGIGLSKTGTTSLNAAFERLGLSTTHWPRLHQVLQLSELDAITDIPVIPFYKVLEQIYPAAKFVLTVRDIDDWLESCKLHWEAHPAGSGVPTGKDLRRVFMYGIATFDKDVFRHVYGTHHADVMWWFKDKMDKLLVMDICAGDGYEVLCPFLGMDVLDEPFPRKNRRKS